MRPVPWTILHRATELVWGGGRWAGLIGRRGVHWECRSRREVGCQKRSWFVRGRVQIGGSIVNVGRVLGGVDGGVVVAVRRFVVRVVGTGRIDCLENVLVIEHAWCPTKPTRTVALVHGAAIRGGGCGGTTP